MASVTKDMVISDMINIDRGIIPILMNSGMHCVGCPSAQAETLEEASVVHGLNADEIISEINDYLAKK